MRILIATAAALVALGTASPVQAAVKWFHSPSGNIQCEVSSGGARGAYAFCQSFKQPRAVQLKRTGRYSVCRGVNCLGNGPENASTLRYGTSLRVGPFRCTSKMSGMRCVVSRSGRGFLLSRDAVRRIG